MRLKLRILMHVQATSKAKPDPDKGGKAPSESKGEVKIRSPHAKMSNFGGLINHCSVSASIYLVGILYFFCFISRQDFGTNKYNHHQRLNLRFVFKYFCYVSTKY